ncbi:DUF4167 domain-containing protein [Candidatus Pelagibacter sp.]|nr:DUF4167 domain-containing protein [Candidatus Pelagibacter sp.]
MVTFRNNNSRRNNFRRNDRNFKSNGERPKYVNNFSKNENFQRKLPGRNNHNASKLIEKYSNLAREALSSGDKILSENYFQHADHFTRILNDQDYQKRNNSTNDNSADLQKELTNKEEVKNNIQEK